MPIATGTALALAAAGAIGGSAIGAGTSLAAAGEQSDAAKSAAQIQAQSAREALDFQKQQYNTTQSNFAPWLQAGQGAIGTLSGLVPQLNAAEAAYPGFKAPTAEEAAATPGYQFTLGQGQQALENSAAARGGLLSGNTAQALDQYSQGLASTTYGDTYNRALQQYQQAYNQFQTGQANQYNRYANLAGVGQTAAGQLASSGSSAAGNIGNILMTSGLQQGNALQNAAYQNASGYVGAGNAFNSSLGNISQYLMFQNYLNQGKIPTLSSAPGPTGQ